MKKMFAHIYVCEGRCGIMIHNNTYEHREMLKAEGYEYSGDGAWFRIVKSTEALKANIRRLSTLAKTYPINKPTHDKEVNEWIANH